MPVERLRVLLVEDDEDDAVLTRDLLSGAQGCAFEMVWADSVRAGLQQVAAVPFDAILLDYRLGEHTGLDFLGRLPPERSVPPVILLTGVGDTSVDMAAMRAGAADYLVKSGLTALLLERSIRYAVERRRNERALRDSEERFRQLANNASAVFWLFDGDLGRTVYVNPAFERVWGRSAAELLRDDTIWRASIHPDDRERLERHAENLPERPYETEYRIVRPDGEVRWVRDRGFPVRDERGRVYRSAGIAEDITAEWEARADHERLLRQVQVERSRLSSIIMQAPAFIAVLRGPEHVYEIVNPTYYGTVGHRPLVGRTVRDSMPELEGQGFFELLDRVFQTGKSFTGVEMPIRLRTGPDGEVESRYVSFVYQAMLDGDGAVEGIFVHGFDVTEQVEARKYVGRLATERRAILSQIADGVVVTDPEGQINFANPAAMRMLGNDGVGISIEELSRGLSRVSRAGEAHEADRLPLLRALRSDEVVHPTEVEIRRPDGTAMVLEASAGPVRAPDGTRIGAVVAMRDVTDRRRAAEELAWSERRFRSLVENAPDAVSVLDPRGRIVYQSPALARMLGCTAAEVGDRNAFAFIHGDDKARVRAVFGRLLERPGAVERVEYRVTRHDGTCMTWESVAQNLLDDPAVAGVVVNSRDLTASHLAEQALRRSEEQLRQAQKMEAVGRLAGGIAHDFNNILTAIQGNTELLLMDAVVGDGMREDLLEIRRAAERAASLTRQLLAFSRKQVLQPRVLNLNHSLVDVEKMLQRLIGEDVALRMELDPGLALVRADPGQVEQVFLNLAVNARDAMPRGGQLRVRTRNVTLTPADATRYPYHVEPGEYAEVAVTDDGEGIPSALLEQVFEPFFTTKEVGKGTGLGLSTVYGIVKQSGGYVWVESTPGEGTEFRVLLPRATDDTHPAPPPEAAPAAVAEGIAATILLVEDELPVRTLALRILQRQGYTILEAGSAAEAIALVEESAVPVDLILTDVVMPGGSGREVADRIRELRPAVRTLFMSGYADDALARHGVLEHGVALIEKPFAPDMLVSRVRQVLRDGS